MDDMKEDFLPVHLGFIVDGNRRWARERGLPTLEGHMRGLAKVEEVAEECFERGVKFVSFYLFSTENWGRNREEVGYIMNLVLLNTKRLAKKMLKKNIKLVILGSRERVSEEVLAATDEAEEMTAGCMGGTMGVCFNYGGRDEIVQAVRKLVERAEEISEKGITECLYRPEMPDCDMIVRTGDEQRISGFMLWRAAYSEFLFLDKKWPEMGKGDVGEIFAEYASRSRRFGK
jgi:undecaprenyl diphosphate synthase